MARQNSLWKIALGILAVPAAVGGGWLLKYQYHRRVADRFYQRQTLTQNLSNQFGSVKNLRILPLVEYYAVEQPNGLKTEPGVAYLIEADQQCILFDLGYKRNWQKTAPLLENMQCLGVDPAQVDWVFNSHPHWDHLSGSISEAIVQKEADPFFDKPVYSTVPLKLSQGMSQVITSPQVLSPGIGTTGPLPAALLLGRILEQSLVINVEGKGLVIIIGCGHPGLERIMAYTEKVFGLPIYAVVGGLHFPVTGDRATKGKIPVQRLLGSSLPPWKPLTKELVYKTIDFLKQKKVQKVSISPHDSCDWTLCAFAEAFEENYYPLKVGAALEF
jgi:7,8-dihydropterin-6-yl-methyl-4-(beta-D-ribofuranosyl)aminobenzene 5'-phosphate synthase